MDDTQQATIFNELHTVAHNIISKIENDLHTTHADINEQLDRLHEVNKQLDDLQITNRNLSAELGKYQEACRILEGERNFLREQNSDLTAINIKLLETLHDTQDELLRTKAAVTNLSNRLSQIQKFLAG